MNSASNKTHGFSRKLHVSNLTNFPSSRYKCAEGVGAEIFMQEKHSPDAWMVSVKRLSQHKGLHHILQYILVAPNLDLFSGIQKCREATCLCLCRSMRGTCHGCKLEGISSGRVGRRWEKPRKGARSLSFIDMMRHGYRRMSDNVRDPKDLQMPSTPSVRSDQIPRTSTCGNDVVTCGNEM